MRLSSSRLTPVLALAGGCLGDTEASRPQVAERPDTLHLLAAFQSETRTRIAVAEQRLDGLAALLRVQTRPAGDPLRVQLGALHGRIATIQSRLAAIGFHDSDRWRTTMRQMDSAFDALWIDLARAEIRARQPP